MTERLYRPMFIVADDAGLHPMTDRGILYAAENKALTHADFMILEEGTKPLIVELKKSHSEIGLGLHIFVPGFADVLADAARSYWCRLRPDNEFRQAVSDATSVQLRKFRDDYGFLPAHLSSHGHIHTDHRYKPFPWFVDSVRKILDSEADSVLIRGLQTFPIRHTRARSAMLGKPPLKPYEFVRMLSKIKVANGQIPELVIHPAYTKKAGDPELPSVLSLQMRERDLQSLLSIIRANVIGSAGFELKYRENKNI